MNNNFRKWKMDIIHDNDNGYRAIISTDSTSDIDIDYEKTWKAFAAIVENKTGIRLPRRKSFKFEKLSDYETIAGCDAATIRPSCIVTMNDRKNGWKRWEI